jgi:hypothetical protein
VAIHHRAGAIECRLPSACPRVPGCVTHRYRADLSVSGSSNAFDGNASIDDSIVVHGVVVDDRGPVVNVSDFGVGQTTMAQIAVIEVVQSDKRKVVRAQAEIEVHPDADTIETPA